MSIWLDSIYNKGHFINTMTLQPGYIKFLYGLLQERDDMVNISHKKMPTFDEHKKFVNSCPHEQWWIVLVETHNGNAPVGQVYITERFEIGVQIAKIHQRQGYARAAVAAVMGLYPRDRLLANINPRNAASIALFEGFGFKHIQNTYELEARG